MLIMTFRKGDAVELTLPDGRKVRVCFRGFNPRHRGALHIGVDAPRDVPIYREEIHKLRLPQTTPQVVPGREPG